MKETLFALNEYSDEKEKSGTPSPETNVKTAQKFLAPPYRFYTNISTQKRQKVYARLWGNGEAIMFEHVLYLNAETNAPYYIDHNDIEHYEARPAPKLYNAS